MSAEKGGQTNIVTNPYGLLPEPPKREVAVEKTVATIPAGFGDYCQQYGWVQDKNTQEYGPFRPNRFQLDVDKTIQACHSAGRPALIIILKARQLGMTTYTQQKFLHLSLQHPGRHSLLVVQDQDTQGIIFDDKLRNQFDHLPTDLVGDKHESNRKRLVLANGSRFVVQISTGVDSRSRNFRTAPSASQRKGRGGTFQYVHGSEVAFWVDPKTTMNAISHMNHPVAGNIRIYESTANGQGGAFHELWLAAGRGDNDFIRKFYSWKDDPFARMPVDDEFEKTAEEEDLAKEHGLSDEQLRWRRYKIANDCSGDSRIFQQEEPLTPEEAFLTTGDCWFDLQKLSVLRQRSRDPLGVGDLEEVSTPMLGTVVKRKEVVFRERKTGCLRIYAHPEKRTAYAIGADVAHGKVGGAFSAAQVGRRDNLSQVAVWHGRIEPGKFADKLFLLGTYYGKAWLAPEVNDAGIYTVGKLVNELKYPETRVYHYADPSDPSPNPAMKPGWQTTQRTRHQLCAAGREHVSNLDVDVPDLPTINEMASFVSPTPDAPPVPAVGAFSDLVMAWQILMVVAPGRLLRY